MVAVGMSGCERGRGGGGKFAQFRDFDGVAGTPDVKTFRPRCTAVPGAVTSPGAGMRTRAARWLHGAGVFIAWLFSSVFLHALTSAAARRLRALPRLAAVERGCGCGRGGTPEGAGCEIFSRGLLTVKKTVIRFRPADLACPTECAESNVRCEAAPLWPPRSLCRWTWPRFPRRNASVFPFRCPRLRSWRALPYP